MTMRIAHLSIEFRDEKRSAIEGWDGPGWYVIATDADSEGHTWAIRPVKITPQQAQQIADAMSATLADRRVTAGVQRQNYYAREACREAADRAARLAADAQRRAEELARWEHATQPDEHRESDSGSDGDG